MPRFGGFNTGNIGGALARNAVGTIANAVLPRTAFGGFGLLDGSQISYPRQNGQDRMVSLRPKPAAANRVYGSGLLSPLKETGGLVWPYTPTITYAHPIDYQTIQTVHSNQDFHIYSKTPAVSLGITGEFTVQNQAEGAYALAALHFLRTMAKMNFGEKDPDAGTPPPVLLFNAYGPFVFKDLPVIVKDFNVEFPADVDYVQVAVSGVNITTTPGRPAIPAVQAVVTAVPGEYGPNAPVATPLDYGPGQGGTLPLLVPARPGVPGTPDVVNSAPQSYTVWLPSMFKITCNLVVQHTSKELRQNFDLTKYRNGDVSQKSWI